MSTARTLLVAEAVRRSPGHRAGWYMARCGGGVPARRGWVLAALGRAIGDGLVWGEVPADSDYMVYWPSGESDGPASHPTMDGRAAGG